MKKFAKNTLDLTDINYIYKLVSDSGQKYLKNVCALWKVVSHKFNHTLFQKIRADPTDITVEY